MMSHVSLRTMKLCIAMLIFVLFVSCAPKKAEKPLPVLEPGEFHIAYADGDSTLVQGKTATLYFLIPAKNDGELAVTFRRDYNEFESNEIKINGNDSLFHTQIEIPEDAYYLTAGANGYGSCYAGSSPVIYEPIFAIDGKPAKNTRGFESSDRDNNRDEYLQKEFENYPDNIMAFSNSWWRYSFVCIDSISNDIERIKALETETPEKDAALALAYAFLKDDEKVMEHTHKYMQNGEHPWLFTIISRYLHNTDLNIDANREFILNAFSNCMQAGDLSHYMSSFMYSAPKEENEKLEAIIDSLFVIEPVSGHLKFQYCNEFLQDTAKTVEFLDKYIEEYYKSSFVLDAMTSKYAITSAMKYGAEYYLKNDDIKKAASFAEPALKYAEKGLQLGDVALINAKIANRLNDNENFEKKIQIAAGNGKLSEIEEYLAKEFPDKDTYSMLTDIFAKAIKHNEKAPDYMFVDTNGDTIRPGNGKIQFIHFWNIGCKPCVEEKPALDEFASKHNIDFYAITNFPKDKTVEKVGEFTNFDNIYSKDMFTSFKLTSVPRTYIIDQNGMVRFFKLGTTQDYTDEEIVIRLLEDETISKRID